MSKAALDQCPLPRRSTNIWFNLCISGPITLAILRTRARAFKILTSLLRSSQISSNFNTQEHSQDPRGQVKDITASVPLCTTNWCALKESRMILAWANYRLTTMILIVKPIQSSRSPFCATDIILTMNANKKSFWIQSLAGPRFSLPTSPANANLSCWRWVIPSLINLIKGHMPNVPC